MVRSWRVVTLSGTGQPVMGDVTTAAISAIVPANGIIPVRVAATARYQAGDRIVIDPGLSTQDALLIDSIPSSTVLNCQMEGSAASHAHATSAVIILSIACSQLLITGFSLAGNVYFGTDSTVTNAGGGTAFTYITPGGNYPLGNPQYNCQRTSDLWMAGPTASTVGVGAVVL